MKFKKITSAQIFLTHKCQLACKYCYENFNNSDDMSYETATKIIDYVLNNAKEEKTIGTISFFGGEPLLKFEDLIKPCVEYIRTCDKNNCNSFTNITMTTNGLCLTEEILKFLKHNNISFMLSFDGCENAENATRFYKDGSSCFKEIDSKFELITKYFPNVQVRITADPANISYLYDSILYLDSKNINNVRIYPNVFSKWSEEDYKILNNQLKLLEDYYIDKFDNFDIPLIPKEFSNMFKYRVLKDYSEENNYHRSIPACNKCERCGGCFNGNGYFDTDGSMYTCSHVDFSPADDNMFYIGNIYDSDNFDWCKVENLYNLNTTIELSSETEDCSKCPIDSICIGTCTPNNYLVTGDFNKATSVYCKWTKSVYNSINNIIEHFNETQDNILFRDYFYGIVNKGKAFK